MPTDRREFLKRTGVSAAGLGVLGAAAAPDRGAAQEAAREITPGARVACEDLPRQGPKEVVRGKRAVASSQSPIVTQTMLDVMRGGGNAADAAVAGMIVQATVQPEMTNHTGTVTYLYHDAASGRTHQLDSTGPLVPHLPPFRTWPAGLGGVAVGPPMACIPGFMPGVAAVHERFGTKPWASLVEPSIPWAEEGFPVDEFQRSLLDYELDGNTYFPRSRALFAPNGFSPSVGEPWRNPELAETLRRLAVEGPAYFTTGGWAREFVDTANALGWKIGLEDMTANPPRWGEPLRYEHRGQEIVQLAPPQRTGVYSNLVLGILRHLEVDRLGHYTESAESLYYMGQALRRAEFELGQLWDPEFFGVPVDVWTSDAYHGRLAEIIRASRPKRGVDLTRHVQLTTSPSQLAAFGWGAAGPVPEYEQPAGSCEITVVDEAGNWVQAMDTLQSGGIPGIVVGGVPMVGSHASFSMAAGIASWLGVPGIRMRSTLGNTMVFRDGRPVLSMGTPGNVHCTVPQMLSSILDHGYAPDEAAVLPRMLPMRDDFAIPIETRIDEAVLKDLARLGARLQPLPPFDFSMGSYQQAWREPDGRLSAATDPRRAGRAGGY